MCKQQIDGKIIKENNSIISSKKNNIKPVIIVSFILLAIFILIIIKVLIQPKITINKIVINKDNYSQIRNFVENFENQKIELKKDGVKKNVKLSDIGFEIEKKDSLDVLDQFSEKDLIKKLFSNSKNIELKINLSSYKAENYLTSVFLNNETLSQNPKPIYDSEKKIFVTHPGKKGKAIDVKNTFNKPLSILKSNHYEIKTLDVEPIINISKASEITEKLNQRIKKRINLNHKGNLIYFPDPWDIAAWTNIELNSSKDNYIISYDKDKIINFLKVKVLQYTKKAPIDQKNLIDKDDKLVLILQQGKKGLKNLNPETTATQIKDILNEGNGGNVELNLTETDFKITEIKVDQSGKWIDVNLSNQTTTLMVGNKKIQTFVISSGLSAPTPVGVFYVWHKTRVQSMTGGSKTAGTYYDIPNVHWNTYFTKSGVAFHEAYWHNNFGHPMSHGCINMRTADSKVVYDFAPKGTRVVTHY